MEHLKILNSLNEPNDSKFVTRQWNIVNDQSNANHDVGNGIIYSTKVSNLCDYNDADILVKGDIAVTAAPATQVSFKNLYHKNRWNNNRWCWSFRFSHINVQSDGI